MSQEVQTYDFHGSAVRIHTDGDNIEYCARDIANALGYANPMKAVRDHCRGERNVHPLQTAGGMQEIAFIGEGDVYRLIVSSQLPAAVEFEHWLFDEVLPSIRKHGTYMTQQTIERVLTDPDTLIRLATDLKHEREARAQAERQVRSLAPKAQAFEDFVDVPDLLTIREAAKLLTTADIQIRESELRAWLVMHKWIYRKGGDYEPYASHVQAGHIRLVAHKSSGRHSDGSRFAFAPTCKLTRRGLILLYQRIGSEQMRNRLPLTAAARSEQPDWWQEEETANVVSAHE